MNATALQTIDQPVTALTSAESAFTLAQRSAKAMASSSLVPEAYRNNVPNVLIAMEVANRIGASPFLVMQNLYIVHGRPSWSSQFLIATVNACGRFTPLRYETVGDDAIAKDFRCRVVASDTKTGEACAGPWITWKMVDAEGWASKNGSKWKSIPDLMFRYRAATFWTRLFAPELSMGIHTAEELQDVWGGGPAVQSAPSGDALRTLEAKLVERAKAAPDDSPMTVAEVLSGIEQAADVDALDSAYGMLGLVSIASPEDRAKVTEAYTARRAAIEGEG